ncbi:MAG: VanW family protein [Clostridia bacterium]|nr:VanW family protein [Clostridia bacterium]
MDTRNRKRSSRASEASQDVQRSGRRKKKNPYKALSRRLFVLAAVLIAALVVVFFLRFRHTHIPSEKKLHSYLDEGTYLSGIVINGKNVSGMTIDEARSAISPMLEETARGMNIGVSYGSSLWLFTGADMKVSSDLEYVLAEAMLYGRGDTAAANGKAKKELKEAGREFAVTFTPDTSALRAQIANIAAAVDTPAVEPSAEANMWATTPSFNYHEGVDGHVLDQEALLNSITTAVSEGSFQALIKPELVTQAPSHSLDWLKENTKLRATWQTDFGSSSSLRNTNRVGNIQKATTLLNGCKVEVGEEFNFNGFIGPRTESGGWPLAPGIVNGNTYEMQAGGGICQVSTTLYNALLCSGSEIEITERYHHSWPSSYADIGLDSTVTGSVDSGKSLNFVNNTGAPLYIFAYCDQTNHTMTIYIYGEPLPEGVTYTTRGEVIETIKPAETVTEENPEWPVGYEEKTVTSREGYKSEVYRDKYVNGTLDSSELLYTDSYRAVQGKITKGTGDPSLPKPTA